jgi:integrase
VETLTRSDGTRRYKVRWREGGRNRARSFDRKRDAEAFNTKLRALKSAGGLDIFNAGEQLLSDYASQWWAQHAEPNLSERTREVYAVQLDKRIMPLLGGYQLRQITPPVVRGFTADMQANGTGRATMVKTLTVLQSILRHAEIDGAIRSNSVKLVGKPSQARERQPILVSPEQVEAIRALLPLPDATLVSMLAYAGLRPESEAIRLTWRNVRERSILVRDTKRGRERSVRLLEPLAEDLAVWRSHSTGPLVFPAGTGGAWKPHDWKNWQRRIFKPAAVKAGLPGDIRARDLRGSFATLLLFEGRNIAEVADQLGHGPETALRDYVSVVHEVDPANLVSADEQIRRARLG